MLVPGSWGSESWCRVVMLLLVVILRGLLLLIWVLPEYLGVVVCRDHGVLHHGLRLRQIIHELLLLGMIINWLLQIALIPVELSIISSGWEQILGTLHARVAAWQRLLDWGSTGILESTLRRGDPLWLLV